MSAFKPSITKPTADSTFAEGSYPARVCAIYKIGTQKDEYSEDVTATKKQVIFQFELVDESVEIDGKTLPVVKSKTFTDTIHPKGKLAPMLAMLGIDTSKEVDLTEALGKPCLCSFAKYKKPDGSDGVKFASVTPPTKGQVINEGSIPLEFFDFDQNFDQVIVATLEAKGTPEKQNWIFEKITQAPEYKALTSELDF